MATSTNTTVNGLSNSLTQYPTTAAKKNSDVDKNDFIKMLVTQLKNQDPLDPMSNDRFAVDLATFSQLEQLVSINSKMGSSKGGDATSMASFLGTDVKLNSQTVHVKDGDGGSVTFKLDQMAADSEIQLLDQSGGVVASMDAGALLAGDQTVALKGIAASDGDYTVKVTAHTPSGGTMTPDAFVAGTVVGYRPGDTPMLIIGDNEYPLSDVVEVRAAKTTAVAQ